MPEGCTESEEMNLVVNGEIVDVPEGASVQALVDSLPLSEKRVAVELNGTVVRRSDWGSFRLNDGDKVEIVHFVGGG
jgi:sulfur carrier protein